MISPVGILREDGVQSWLSQQFVMSCPFMLSTRLSTASCCQLDWMLPADFFTFTRRQEVSPCNQRSIWPQAPPWPNLLLLSSFIHGTAVIGAFSLLLSTTNIFPTQSLCLGYTSSLSHGLQPHWGAPSFSLLPPRHPPQAPQVSPCYFPP